jgi:hypothetical protein
LGCSLFWLPRFARNTFGCHRRKRQNRSSLESCRHLTVQQTHLIFCIVYFLMFRVRKTVLDQKNHNRFDAFLGITINRHELLFFQVRRQFWSATSLAWTTSRFIRPNESFSPTTKPRSSKPGHSTRQNVFKRCRCIFPGNCDSQC